MKLQLIENLKVDELKKPFKDWEKAYKTLAAEIGFNNFEYWDRLSETWILCNRFIGTFNPDVAYKLRNDYKA